MPSRTRLISLDVFRGLTMAGMVIVNNPGDWGTVYWPLLHAEWNGWTPTDLIFPFFLFIVGVSITLSQKSASWASIARRAALIFVLGLFLAGYPRFNLTRWRIPGVLQRIALCYLAAAAINRLSMTRERAASDSTATPRNRAIAIGLLALILGLGYWAVMMLVPPPGGVAGDLTPDGNLAAWLDRALMPGHLWKPKWDPEGLLSTVPAISTTLFGVVAGLCLTSALTNERKVRLLGIGGTAALIAGWCWGLVFPINKSLWTSSYAVFTAGFGALLLAGLYWIIDIKGWTRWTKPFVVLGSNAITLFMASGLLVKTLALIRISTDDGQNVGVSRWAYLHGFVPLASPKNASLLYALANLVVLYALLAWMYRRRLFLRV
ncbi:MAG TPA: heparan-alpha-glucosaminide N-acetyltransferase domain-containing protein [Vicinamibacterales bacterium]|nr:heparan-alpha-glucosaminide N-acetyltransferase domain-containing protein [Vicinamibacterales bacterium]